MQRSATALVALVLTATASPAAVVTKVVEYDYDGVKLKGFLAFDDAVKEKRPGVLVVHEWWGLDDYAKGRCKQLAELGYVAFAPDMYGEGKVVNHPDDSGKMASAVRANVTVWRGRAEAGLKQLKGQPNVDGDKLAAIGYCFGGSTCLQLAYGGADLKAVATFHAALPKPTEAEAKAIKPKLLVCHGAADTFISAQSIKDFRGALDAAGTKYEFVAYPDVVHSFTVPGADAHNIKGMKYDKHADEDSWKKMLALFKDTLGR
ncbi:dienelactone hydrolase family protein [Gemmata sp. JC673]|uniref:Dienelactone hydrolase family protein n=1 Tax=Gemmata algarum TaxID=2975278 RepID=A0ABU5F3J2_9BACT|nr:dienelactone hydrolase family protein [Gemmata algarum]MDY3562074.1 dienelactone hydrolase family protein [Gemmata algarum]